MNFIFAPRRVKSRRVGDSFTVEKLWADKAGLRQDLSHLIDRSYRYCSHRELRWHLADRFGLAPDQCALRPA
ncbi:MAG: hypothetical protein KF735_10055 [Chelatococcus sp.]|uniref:hypothetical protein n=1 Tax=unclassified Chelatococcus TaxID=2638111 RepID=UPI001BCCF15F|nr:MULTISPECIES: hypothetical protein [unclassified Chelatococcus]CAH1673526.1 conserved hypothetical protein [Hyphomicrobiales bacterium]MBS7738723.1 hypothetical protein [Chelatococcus sp. HY11]MBX3537971.1 hypothetical protein [Chelatococcus sp.]MBX3543127.1 hypothetical protein [Chelatococcus sp.]MCO5076746.1 hypothetical protein [Chelatococcus sp.]